MRRNWLRPSRLVATSMVALSGSPAAAALMNCRIDAVDAFEAAQNADFGFSVVQTNATQCELVESTIIVAAPEAQDATCRVQLFAGKSAANGWRLLRLRYSASDNTEVDVSNLRPGWLFDIKAPRAQTSRVSIDNVVIRGPKCQRWKDAFASDE